MSFLIHFLRRFSAFSIISSENLSANVVIDAFITFERFNFPFNQSVVQIAFPIECNNEELLPHCEGWVPQLAVIKVYQTVYNI